MAERLRSPVADNPRSCTSANSPPLQGEGWVGMVLRVWSGLARHRDDALVDGKVLARVRILFAIAVLSVTAPMSAAAPAFAIDQVASGVFVHLGKQLPLDALGHDDIANIGFIVGARCVAVIDTGGS